MRLERWRAKGRLVLPGGRGKPAHGFRPARHRPGRFPRL